MQIEQAAVQDGASRRDKEDLPPAEKQAGADDDEDVQQGKKTLDAPGDINQRRGQQQIPDDLHLREQPKTAEIRQQNRGNQDLQAGQAAQQIEGEKNGGQGGAAAMYLKDHSANQKEPDDQRPGQQIPAQLASGDPGLPWAQQGVQQPAHQPPTVPASLKIGRYMAITRPPTVVPRKSMSSGSIMAVRLATASSTSSS